MGRAKDNRRMQTQRQQRIAKNAGTWGPRKLARSIARAIRRSKGQKQSEITGWRQMVKELPPTGKRCLHGKQ
jgi:hypothetical protein